MAWATTSADFFFDVSANRVDRLGYENRVGKIDAPPLLSLPATVWTPGTKYEVPTSAALVAAWSDSNDDDIAGPGARRLLIDGLSEDWDEIGELISMDAGAPAISALKYRRINRCVVIAAGSVEANVGTVTIKHGALTLAHIDPGVGSTQQAVFSIPRNRNGFLTKVWANLRQAPTVPPTKISQGTLSMSVRSGIHTSEPAKSSAYQFSVSGPGSSHVEHSFQFPLKILGPADLLLELATINDFGESFHGGFSLAHGDIAVPSGARS